jgi:hypothetical protein
VSAVRRGAGIVLYVNSALRESDWFIVPTSITTLMQTLPARWDRLGVFAWELTDDLIRSSSVVVLDCHWFTSLPETLGLIRWIRELCPETPIILGGYTAQLFYRELLPLTGAGYVIRGDNEQPFPLLVDALCRGDSDEARRLPNVAGAGFANPIAYRFGPEDYAGLSFGIDWFPAYRRRIAMINRGNHLGMDHEFYRYPLLVMSKGCSQDCSFCLGSTTCYGRLFDRGQVPIPVAHLEAILRRLEQDPETPAVHLYFNWPVAEYRAFFSRNRFDLDLKSQIDIFPDLEDLRILEGAFRTSVFYVSLGHSVYSDRAEAGIDYRRYLDAFDSLKFFVSRAQHDSLRDAYGNRLLSTTDTWRVPELFEGYDSSLKKAVASARRLILEDPRSWAFRLILREHGAYRRRLFSALGLEDREVRRVGMHYSQEEYILHLNAC